MAEFREAEAGVGGQVGGAGGAASGSAGEGADEAGAKGSAEGSEGAEEAERAGSEAEREAVATALQEAAALRGWIAQYNAFDKLRVRRLGPVISEFVTAQTLPLVLAQRG